MDIVAGIPAPAARDLVRGYTSGWEGVGHAMKVLEQNESAAREILDAFVHAGLLESQNIADGAWVTTVSGNALAMATFGAGIKRRTAEAHLNGVIERTKRYNADSTKILSVRKLYLFGSYLDPTKSELSDIDFAIEVVRRVENEDYISKSREFTRKSGRQFARYIDELGWPVKDLIMTLRNRSSAISITGDEISALTGRFECVYQISDDSGAIQPPANARIQPL